MEIGISKRVMGFLGGLELVGGLGTISRLT